MISMWDDEFAAMNDRTGSALASDSREAFELMHRELDRVWKVVFESLVPGGLCCINIGDAVRTVEGRFQLFPNHLRVAQAMGSLGFDQLPGILWRKPTNSPTKFMGSGMLPSAAYVTLEHEHILIFRKPGTRHYPVPSVRRRSAVFWEERNRWFSDLWDIPAAPQSLKARNRENHRGLRLRSAAYPMELPFRLISMFSAYGETVFDPFAGTLTTARAAIAAGRSSYCSEHADQLIASFWPPDTIVSLGERARERVNGHADFVVSRLAGGKEPAHRNGHVPVVTSQERELEVWEPVEAEERDGEVLVRHERLELFVR